MPDPRPAIPGLTAIVSAIVALGPLTISMYAPSMPSIAHALDTTTGMVQITFSIYLIGLAFGQLLYGPLSDRFGRRRILIVGLLIYVLGSAACFLAGSIEVLIAARLVQAIGACAGPAVGRAVVRDAYSRERAARVMALVGVALAVGPAVGPIIGGYLQIWLGWQAVFVALSAVGAILLMIVAARLPETNGDPDPSALHPRRLVRNYASLLRDRTYLGYVAPAAVTLGGLFAFNAAGPFLLIDLVGLTPDQYGWTGLVTVTGYVLGSYLASRVSERIGLDRMIAASTIFIFAGAALMLGFALGGSAGLATILGPMALWVFGMGLALPNAMAGALAPFPRMAGAASALLGFLQMGAGALGSVAVARFDDGTAVTIGGLLVAMAIVGYLPFHLLIWRRRGSAPEGSGA